MFPLVFEFLVNILHSTKLIFKKKRDYDYYKYFY